MRIIGGKFKGKKLVSLTGNATRPTADRVRESIFNIMASDIENAAVLDLFAGTGALGLESLSRGAARTVFIDASTPAIKIIQKNVSACGADARARIIRWDITRNLKCLEAEPCAIDLVFMDPPYNKNFIMPALKNLIKSGALKKSARIVIEHSAEETLPEDLMGLHLADRRIYGKTLVSFLSVMLQKNFSETDKL